MRFDQNPPHFPPNSSPQIDAEKTGPWAALLAVILTLSACQAESNTGELPLALASNQTVEERLGEALFQDTTLSEPPGQACQSCHDPVFGYATPPALMQHGVSQGVVAGLFGARNAPTAAYAAFSPEPYFDAESRTWVGGQFHDQRARSLEEQARGPFLNPLEMANTDAAQVVGKVRERPYADLFRAVYGQHIFSDPDQAYIRISEAIAAYERTAEFSPFSSKYDAFLREKASLSPSELRGLGATQRVNQSAYYGRFKVPTLRNVAVTAPYMHNGVFTTLEEVVRFYNTACAPGNPDGWAAPEYAATRNCREMGNLHLTDGEVSDLVAFLHTLTDGTLAE